MMKSSTPVATVGIDVSERYLHTCEITEHGEVLETARFVNSAQKVEERFAELERRRVVIEVGSHTRWITEMLTGFGHEVLVVDPRRLKLISGTFYKDDKIDAEMLATLGQTAPHLLKTVKMRDEPHQQALTVVRSRATLVHARTKVINAVRGMLKPYGVRISKSGRSAQFGVDVREKVSGELLATVEPLLDTLDHLNVAIKSYDAHVKTLLPKLAPDAMHLLEIPGIAELTLLYFVALVGDPQRFAKSRTVGSYFGLCPRRDDSGDYKSELGITKAGDPYMRALLANCASHILGPFGKDSDLRRWGLRRAGGGSRVEKRRAKVAVARKLAVLLLTLWKSGDKYDRFHHSKTPAEADEGRVANKETIRPAVTMKANTKTPVVAQPAI